MADYTELVKKLRNRRVCLQTGLNLDNDYPLLREAADAIEELEKKMLNWQATADDHWEAYQHWFHKYMDDMPKWIPVTEQPKPGQYLVHKLYDHGYGEYHSYDILTFTDNLNKVDKYDFRGKEYKRPGWFDYDSEYGHFECGDNITHYMPLPEPPKEEP